MKQFFSNSKQEKKSGFHDLKMTEFNAGCVKFGWDYIGFDLYTGGNFTNHWADCAELCRKIYWFCHYWTWNISSKVCWLKDFTTGYIGGIFLR